MANEVIMLAKSYKKGMDIYPAFGSEKLDGVAAKFKLGSHEVDGYDAEYVDVESRQGKPLYSVDHIIEWLENHVPSMLFDNSYIVGELYIKDRPFKEISGIVRSEDDREEQSELGLYIYDYYNEDKEQPYYDRMAYLTSKLHTIINDGTPVQLIKQHLLQDDDAVLRLMADLKNRGAEGAMIRKLHGADTLYKLGRSKGLLKNKFTYSEDLGVQSFEEAMSKTGEPLGRVGRINLHYKGIIIGAGPGSMKHDERKHVWDNRDDYLGNVAEIKYMPDPSYDALREARFYRWRKDKDEIS